MSEGTEQEALTHFLWLPAILPYRVPSTPEEFAAVANEDLAFIHNLSATGMCDLF